MNEVPLQVKCRAFSTIRSLQAHRGAREGRSNRGESFMPSGARSPKPKTKPEVLNPKSETETETRSPKPETRNSKPGTRNPKPGTPNPKP